MSSDGLPPPRAPVSHPLLHPGTAPKPSHEPDASDSNYLLATRIPDRGASRGALAKTVEVVGQTVEDGPRTDSRGGKESPISIQIDRGEDEKDGEKSDRMDESSEKSPDVSIAASSPLHLNSANSHPVSSPSHLSPNYHSATSPNQLSAKPSLTIRRVPLSERGNLQLEIPVPTSILSRPGTALLDAPEVTLTRYTAVTDNPSDFATAGYSLRPPAFNRTTELSVALTLYNEDPLLFARSMSALSQNLAMLSQKWGPHAWEKFIVVIVADGRAQIHPGTLNALSVLGVFQEGVMKSHVGGREVQAHVFEYTTQVELYEEKGVVKTKVGGPMQVIFCLKEKNAKKINSHRWFFSAFSPLLNPRICLLLDAGTRPSPSALWNLWRCFDRHPNVGGACGEIVADLEGGWGVTNGLVAAQAFEYKISNQLDKPLESAFGYISVLPGAFSAYRYSALTDHSPGHGPLSAYFRGEEIHSGAGGGLMEANVYLAEDRVLCFELIAKEGEAWRLRYVAAASATTDVPDSIPELVGQRRRWLNGSTFASIYAIANWHRIYRAHHSIPRKAVFTFQLFFHILSLIFGWFMLGNFFLVPYFLLRANVPGPDKVPPLAFGESGGIVFQIITVLYAYCLLIQFLLSMGSKPSSTLTLYRMIMFLWTAMFGVTMYLLAFAAWKIITSAQIEILQLGFFVAIRGHPALISFIAAAIACWGVWIIAGIAFGDPWHVFHSVFQFMLLSPWWTNVLQVNAMANVHDVSWGTKGAAKGHALSAAKPVHGDGLKENAEVEMELPDTADIEEINRIYEEQVAQLAKPVVHEEGNAIARMFARPVIKDQEERFRTYRIVMLLIWVTSNLALVFAVTNPTIEQLMIESSGAPINPYLSLLFYTTCFFSAVKLLGMFYYLLFQRLIDFKEPIKSQYVGNTLAKRPAFRSQVSVAVA